MLPMSLTAPGRSSPNPPREAAAAHFGAIGDLLAAAGQPLPEKHSACDRAESNAGRELMSRADKVGDRKTRLASKIASAMTSFRNAYPVETAELDSAVEAATATVSCTSGSRTTTCPASRTSSRRT